MSDIEGPFTISFGDNTVSTVEDTGERRIQAKIGSDAAVFTLKDGQLESEDWIVTRDSVEDRSLLPKAVYFFPKSSGFEPIHKTTAQVEEDGSYRFFVGGAPWVVINDQIRSDLTRQRVQTFAVNKV
ncbi:hypothetical protein PT974_01876 [Cladobotryum mycophilum]|uniref:Uncharacterized protein n=1 Tax=Cladobotryum mycophilum TaxID=491253 RepID=A0ABR0SXP2_9HYPO